MDVRLGRLTALCLILAAVCLAAPGASSGGHHLQVNATSPDQKKNESTNAVSNVSIAAVTPQQLSEGGQTIDRGLNPAKAQISNYTGGNIGIDNRAELNSGRLAYSKAKRIARKKKITKKKRSKKTRKSSARTSSRRMRKLKVNQSAVPNNISGYPTKGLIFDQSFQINGMPSTPNVTGNLTSPTNQFLSIPKPTQILSMLNESNNTLQKPSNLTTNKTESVTNLGIPDKDMKNSNLTTAPQTEIVSNNATEPIKKAIKSRFFIIRKPPKTNNAATNSVPHAANRAIFISNLSRFSKLRRSSSRSSLNKTRHEITETIIHEYEHPEITTKKPKPIRREGGPKFFLIKEPPKNSTEKPPPKPMPKLVTRRIVSKQSHTTTSSNSTNSSSTENSSNMSQLVISGVAAKGVDLVANLVPQLIPSVNNTTPFINHDLTSKPVSMNSPGYMPHSKGLIGTNGTHLVGQQSSNIMLPQNVAQGISLHGATKLSKVRRKSTKRKRKKVKKTMKKTSRQITKKMKQLLKNTSMLNALQNNTKIN